MNKRGKCLATGTIWRTAWNQTTSWTYRDQVLGSRSVNVELVVLLPKLYESWNLIGEA